MHGFKAKPEAYKIQIKLMPTVLVTQPNYYFIVHSPLNK